MNNAEHTKHKADCKRVFRRYDPDCSRCQALAAGAPTRKGWARRDAYIAYNPTCAHGDRHLNPGGYCNLCGVGRDYS